MRGKSPLISLFVKVIMSLIAYVLCQDQEVQDTNEYGYNSQINAKSLGTFLHLKLKL